MDQVGAFQPPPNPAKESEKRFDVDRLRLGRRQHRRMRPSMHKRKRMGKPVNPAPEDTLMTTPCPCLSMYGRTTRVA